MKKKTVALLMACVLAVGCVIGGTLAWLTDKTDPVKNTFTTSNIDITLAENVDTNNDGKESFQMIPGYSITKDPKVTVKADSEKCYLFVKVDEAGSCTVGSTKYDFDSFLTYSIADGWIAGNGTGDGKNGVPDGVYYREVDASAADQAFDVIGYQFGTKFMSNQVYVKDTVTKEMMDALEGTDAVQPTLTFTAYASQYMKDNNTHFTAAEAWNNVNP